MEASISRTSISTDRSQNPPSQGRVLWADSRSYIPPAIYLTKSRQKVIWMLTRELGLKKQKLISARHLLAHLDSCFVMHRYRNQNGFVPIRYEHFDQGKLGKCPRKELVEADLLEVTDYRYTEHRSREYRIGATLRDKLAETIWVPGEPSVKIVRGEVKKTQCSSQPAPGRRFNLLSKEIFASSLIYLSALKLEQRPISLDLNSVLEFHNEQKAQLLRQKRLSPNDHVAYCIQCQIDHREWCLQELIRKGSYDQFAKTVTLVPDYVVHKGGRRYCPEIQNLPKNYKRILFDHLEEIDLKSCYTVLLGIIFARAGADITCRFKLLEEPNYKENLARRLEFTEVDTVKPIIHALEFGGKLSWKKLSPRALSSAIQLYCEQIVAAQKGHLLPSKKPVPAIVGAIIKGVAIEEEIDLTIDNIPTSTVKRIVQTCNEATIALGPLEEENKRAILALHKWAKKQAKEGIITNAIGQKLDLNNLPRNRHDRNNTLIAFLVQGLEAQLIAITEVELSKRGAMVIINEHDGFRCDLPITAENTEMLRDKLLQGASSSYQKRLIQHVKLVTKSGLTHGTKIKS